MLPESKGTLYTLAAPPMPTAPATTVLERILDWSTSKPTWQRDALRRIVSQGRPDDTALAELVVLCKQGKGAAGTGLTAIPLDKTHLPATPGHEESVFLHAISEVCGVNNLASAQTLAFEPAGITIIYGDNGAGKSGYARLLKRACRARHPGKIEPNIYADQPPATPAHAQFTYAIGGAIQPAEYWQDSATPHPTLSAVSVFDRACAAIHITAQNEVAFRPFGLDIPDELADVCQRLKAALLSERSQIQTRRHPVFSQPHWNATTAVGMALSSLDHTTDFQNLKRLAELSTAETARLQQLREDLAKDPVKAAAEQTITADTLQLLQKTITAIADQTGDTPLAEVSVLHQDAKTKREAARLSASTAFAGEGLDGIGGAVWRQLWESARRYSTQVAYRDQPFPPSEDDLLCVLCQQPLGAASVARMSRFEEFIQRDTERHAEHAETIYHGAKSAISRITISLLPVKSALQHLRIHTPKLARRTTRYLACARLRRYVFLRDIDSANGLSVPASMPSPMPEIADAEAIIREYSNTLRNSVEAKERRKLEVELAELTDRAILSQMLVIVEQEIQRLKQIQFLSDCMSDITTNSITNLGNAIADTLITPALRDRFLEEIVKLAAEKVRVEIVRSGGKYGSPRYQIKLLARPDAKVGEILSEGEQTCVGLAGFLTELAIAPHRSALVFDDPVSSLDHRWRKQVAKRLVEESAHRQIIIFTHDLIFVTDVYDLAIEVSRSVRCVTLARGQSGTGIVDDGLPWQGKRVEERIDRLEKDARSAKVLYDDNQEDEYKRTTASIYDSLRASWERALEDVAFFRVIQRHRDYINTKDLKKATVFTDQDAIAFQAGFKKCCDVVDAHDPSRGRNAAPPPPSEVQQDIQQLKEWVASLRDRQKQIA